MLLHAFALVAALSPQATGQTSVQAETFEVTSGALTLQAFLWRPSGRGPFPAVLFNHGSYSIDDPMPLTEPAVLGPLFARHGYVFLFLFRQGIGLSQGQGTADGDLMASALAADGQEGRNRVQLQLLEGEELDEALAGLAFLRALPDVDSSRIAVAGHSFGGSLTLFLAAREPTLRAAVVFGAAAGSWDQSPVLRDRLLAAVHQAPAPVFFIHAANDYSVAPGQALSGEMRRLKKPYRLKVYPSFGRTTRDGHNLLYRSVATWERDVFAFLDEHLRARPDGAPLIGTWTARAAAGRIATLKFLSGGRFEVEFRGDDGADVSGRYQVADNELTITDEAGFPACLGPAYPPGRYRFTIFAGELMLVAIRDDCEGRITILERGSGDDRIWWKKK